MNKLKLKLLSHKYALELSKYNDLHLKDYIATNVILCLSTKLNSIDSSELNELTLYTLIHHDYLHIHEITGRKNNLFQVPTILELNTIIENCKSELKKYDINLHESYNLAAATWLNLMIKSNLILENQVIDLNSFELKDFITDDKLISITTGINKNKSYELTKFCLNTNQRH